MVTMTLQLLAADRQTGKTTQALAWISQGERIQPYPGWSRVLLVATLARLDHIRADYWPRLDDFSHRVYSVAEWMPARGIYPNTEVCADDLDACLMSGLDIRRMPGHLTAATITAHAWAGYTFRERTERT